MHKQDLQSGFTLIETLLYIALFVLVIGAVIVATYNMIAATDKTQFRSLAHNEAQFITHKLTWLLNDAIAATTTGSTLTIDYASSPDVVVDLNNGRVRVDGTELNGSVAPVTSLAFVVTPAAGGSPTQVQMTFQIQNQYYNETFVSKKLIR